LLCACCRSLNTCVVELCVIYWVLQCCGLHSVMRDHPQNVLLREITVHFHAHLSLLSLNSCYILSRPHHYDQVLDAPEHLAPEGSPEHGVLAWVRRWHRSTQSLGAPQEVLVRASERLEDFNARLAFKCGVSHPKHARVLRAPPYMALKLQDLSSKTVNDALGHTQGVFYNYYATAANAAAAAPDLPHTVSKAMLNLQVSAVFSAHFSSERTTQSGAVICTNFTPCTSCTPSRISYSNNILPSFFFKTASSHCSLRSSTLTCSW